MRCNQLIKKERRRGMGTPAAMVIVGNAGWRPALGNSTKTNGAGRPQHSTKGSIPCGCTSEISAIP